MPRDTVVHEEGGYARVPCPLCGWIQNVEFYKLNVELGYRSHYCRNCHVCFNLDLRTGKATVT